MKGVAPCLWFDGNAEEAARYYTSVIPNSRITHVSHYGESASDFTGVPEGSVLTVDFEIQGQPFIALNGGPDFKFTPAISLMLHCETQEEVDHLWNNLADGGETSRCGWLTDKYGVTWQVVPVVLRELLQDSDKIRSERVMQAMLTMTRLKIRELQEAADGAEPQQPDTD